MAKNNKSNSKTLNFKKDNEANQEKSDSKNQSHNIKKEALGPNTRRDK